MTDRFGAGIDALAHGVLVLAVGLVLGGTLFFSGPEPPAYGVLPPSAPVRITMPGIKVDAPIVPVELGADRVLDPPRESLLVGWWDASARPGAETGQTVITGHTVNTGGGALDRLSRVRPGQVIDVKTGEGTMRYRAEQVRFLGRAGLARRSQQLFGQDRGSGRLVLVSCAGWNGRSYDRNVVVLAVPLGSPLADA